MGKVVIKLVDLMKAIKQNFYRAEIFLKDKPVGILILIYDVFIEKSNPLKLPRENHSELKLRYHNTKSGSNSF